MNIEEIREALRGAKRDGIMIDMPYTVIRFLLSEVDRLTAELKEKHLEAQGYLCERDYHESEIERLNDLLAEKEGECERWHKAFTHYHVNNGVLEESHRAVNAQLKIEGKRAQDMANLAASRPVDHDSYRAAVEDALVVANIGVASGDAKTDLNKLLAWEVSVALDPLVSEAVDDLVKKVAGEICSYLCKMWPFIREETLLGIKKKYGVE